MRPDRSRAPAVACLSLLTALSLTSCGGSPSSAGSTTSQSTTGSPSSASASQKAPPSSAAGTSAAGHTPNPCALVTGADAGHALGATVGKPIHSAADVADTCTYQAAGAKLVSIIVRAVPKAAFDRSAAKAPGVTAVSGLGVQTYNGDKILQFWKSGIQVAIGVDGLGSGVLNAEKTLVKVAAGRL